MDGNDGGDNGAEYRCLITDANGDMGSTRIATIKLDILDWEKEIFEYASRGGHWPPESFEKVHKKAGGQWPPLLAFTIDFRLSKA